MKKANILMQFGFVGRKGESDAKDRRCRFGKKGRLASFGKLHIPDDGRGVLLVDGGNGPVASDAVDPNTSLNNKEDLL